MSHTRTLSQTGRGAAGAPPRRVPAEAARRIESCVFLALLVLCNLHLLSGLTAAHMTFDPVAVRGGEWWRLFTHAFAHVSWYHLLLDAGTFPWLYRTLQEQRVGRRLLYVGVCLVSSLLAATWFAPEVASVGLCGLSGISHGLLAICLLEMITSRNIHRGLGIGMFLLLVSKGVFEALSGQVVLAWMHPGDLGSPIAVAHTGGLVGGVLAFVVIGIRRGRQPRCT